jgi:hypothetical protein
MDIIEFINGLTPEEIEEGNRKQMEVNQKVFTEFKAAYDKGYCSLCSNALNHFDENDPCFHWFLYPDGIKKKHFEVYLNKPISFFRFDSYIRWVANLEAPFKNINDLKGEMNPAKITEYTIRYKNIEWSVNIGKTDRHGHPNSKNAEFPHFHIQMTVNGNVFLKFNDFHIPFSKEDIDMFRLIEEKSDKVVWRNTFGEGMSILEDVSILETLDSLMKSTDNNENATFNTSTQFQMPEGKTISGEMLEQIFKESKSTKIPIRHLIKKYYPDVISKTEIRPGNGVPEMKKRNKRS